MSISWRRGRNDLVGRVQNNCSCAVAITRLVLATSAEIDECGLCPGAAMPRNLWLFFRSKKPVMRGALCGVKVRPQRPPQNKCNGRSSCGLFPYLSPSASPRLACLAWCRVSCLDRQRSASITRNELPTDTHSSLTLGERFWRTRGGRSLLVFVQRK